ncbi:phosphoribosyl-ATP pyrophosphohydrolase [Devosia sp. ZB163]|uniref:phosphoribosyl-ATP pyrophosphohydrolase n=1 Tax=Devosia sp. ZB163 TaxID=3025938 RepID=UPI00236251AB|nr:phosphoribosyl-ATP pyrophosphohydrolase [Devosia sp. ZB163]MDC9824377.1 phosphoribosyl-ATP pyrophosphohydrolase [Devosia sp. ZB163]
MASLAELADRVERVSAIYAERCNINRDADWYALKLQEEAGELVAEYLRGSGRGRTGDRSPEAIRTALENEAADLMAQLLLFCRNNAIDVEAALDRKWFVYLPESDRP